MTSDIEPVCDVVDLVTEDSVIVEVLVVVAGEESRSISTSSSTFDPDDAPSQSSSSLSSLQGPA